jgi:hypothetical protein
MTTAMSCTPFEEVIRVEALVSELQRIIAATAVKKICASPETNSTELMIVHRLSGSGCSAEEYLLGRSHELVDTNRRQLLRTLSVLKSARSGK